MSEGAQTPTQLRYGLMAKLRYLPTRGRETMNTGTKHFPSLPLMGGVEGRVSPNKGTKAKGALCGAPRDYLRKAGMTCRP